MDRFVFHSRSYMGPLQSRSYVIVYQGHNWEKAFFKSLTFASHSAQVLVKGTPALKDAHHYGIDDPGQTMARDLARLDELGLKPVVIEVIAAI